jgi:uncharacterized protein (DUF433 family)/DNA-binding transcriptional MerR regulator
MAAALSGATPAQLQHWRRDSATGAVLVPEISESKRILYSFRDVIALRTCVFLRQDVSLQKIRKAIGTLRDFGQREHLSQYRLVAVGDSIALLDEKEAIDLVRNPGQLIVTLGEVVDRFAAKQGTVIPALFEPRERLSVDPETRGGIPVVAGTRIPYNVVADLVRDGVKPERVKDYYPAVTPEAALDAAEFADYVDTYKPVRGAVAAS